jgi:hypothetical protein
VAFARDGRLFVGGARQGVFRSDDGGVTWQTIIPSGSEGAPPVSDIVASARALYIGFNGGIVWKSETFTAAGLVQIVDPFGTTPCVIHSGLWTRLAVVPGAHAAQDKVYIGTVALSGSEQWSFFASLDGGATCVRRMNGLDGNSVFTIAVDPHDPRRILLGTVGGGCAKNPRGPSGWRACSRWNAQLEGRRLTDDLMKLEEGTQRVKVPPS